MKSLSKIKNDLFYISKAQKEYAWLEKDYNKAQKARKEEQITFEKYKLVRGIIMANEKGNKNDK